MMSTLCVEPLVTPNWLTLRNSLALTGGTPNLPVYRPVITVKAAYMAAFMVKGLNDREFGHPNDADGSEAVI
jgi:hypothetical protein